MTEIQYFSYRLIDPNGNIVSYNTENFSYIKGDQYHAMGLQWMKDIQFDTVTFPNISGKYIFEINYNGFIGIDGIFRFKSDQTTEKELAIATIERNQPNILKLSPNKFP